MTERGASRGLLACLLLSGMSGLVYEVAWVRSLELIFGATTFAIATVLASFMGGLAAGSWLAGVLSPRLARHHPLRIYAAFEALIAVAALMVPTAFRALVPIHQFLWGSLHASFAVFSVVRFLLCAAVLLVPTALMGATLPVVSRFAAGHAGGEAARRVGLLFAINTFGAVVGCAAAGLALLPALGLVKTQMFAVVLNLAAAAGAWSIARRAPRLTKGAPDAMPDTALDAAPESPDAAGSPEPGAGLRPVAPAQVWLLVGAYAASGAVAMLYEVAWSRFLVLVLGSSTYSYTIMLTTFLVGLTVGAWMGTRLVRAGDDAVLAVGLCQLCVGIATYAGLFVAGELPYLYHLLHDAFDPSPRGLLGIQMLLAASVMFLPTLGLGAMFPLTIAGLGLSGARAQPLVARAYAWNTCGAIAGSLLAGFWLIPLVGSRNVLVAGVVLNTAIAIAALLLSRSRQVPAGRRAVLAGLAVAFLANLFLSAPAWRPDLLSSGIFRYADRYRGLDRAAFLDKVRQSHGDILMIEEGLTCTVAVFRTTQAMSLLVNGKPDASVPPGLQDPAPEARPLPPGDLPTQVLVGQLPLLFATRADDVLVIGLGSGVTLGSVLAHPVRQVDCLELEAAVVRGSRFFDAESGAPLRDPRVRMVVNDARNDLLVRDRGYDVIVSEPSNPWIPGAASLFTRDFFRIARARLRPDGIFCQWIQLYELWPEDFQAILRSFMEVFPSVQIWRVGTDAVLLAGPGDLELPVGRLISRASDRVRGDFARIGIRSPEDLLAHFWIGGDELRRAVTPGPVNTDDNMRIEFAAPLRMLSRDPATLQRQASVLRDMFAGRTSGALPHLKFPGPDPGKQAEFLARLAAATLQLGYPAEAATYAERALALAPVPEAAQVQADALAALGRAAEARAAREAAGREFPGDAGVRRMLLEAARSDGDIAGVRRHATVLVALDPDDGVARLRLAETLEHDGDPAGALAALEPLATGIDRAPDGAALVLGRLRLARGRAADAIPPLREQVRRHPGDGDAGRLLARALRETGAAAEAEAIERPLRPEAQAEAASRLEKGRAAFLAGRLDEARALFEEALTYAPGEDDITYLLARTRARRADPGGAIAVVEAALAARPDRPWAIGYLSELLAAAGSQEKAAAMAARYRALTGHDWTPVGD
jgi:spermidine synthase